MRIWGKENEGATVGWLVVMDLGEVCIGDLWVKEICDDFYSVQMVFVIGFGVR